MGGCISVENIPLKTDKSYRVKLVVDVDDLLLISRSRGSPSAANQQRIRARTHVRGTEKPPPPRSSDAAEAQLFCRIATGNMYLASPRPWGINSRGGERSFTRRCERQVRRGAPFIGGGGNPKGVAGAWGCPLALPSSCGSTLHSQISFKFPPLKSPLKFPLNFHQI